MERREQLDIRPLAPAIAERYSSAWREVQARFVDDPSHALEEADRLVTTVMIDRGYPKENFEQRAADITVDHAVVTSNYRSAHQISAANARGEALDRGHEDPDGPLSVTVRSSPRDRQPRSTARGC